MSRCKYVEVDQCGYKREFHAEEGMEIYVRELPGGSVEIIQYKGHPLSPSCWKVLAHVTGKACITTHWGN